MQTRANNPPPPAFIAFFVFWILLGIAGAIFYRVASYRTKKFWHPFFAIASGVIFFAFVEFASAGQVPVFFAVPIAIVTYLNLRNVRFCPKCDKTLYNHGWSRDKFCSKCGANLDEENQIGNQPIE